MGLLSTLTEGIPVNSVAIIKLFGGPSELGKVLGIGQSAVSNWNDRNVPGVHHLSLLRLARKRGIELSADDLSPPTNRK